MDSKTMPQAVQGGWFVNACFGYRFPNHDDEMMTSLHWLSSCVLPAARYTQ